MLIYSLTGSSLCSPDNGYYFPYSKRYRGRRGVAEVSLLKDGGAAVERRRKDPVLLLPWWKEILGTMVFCIAATTYIVRKFFHPTAPVEYVRVRPHHVSHIQEITRLSLVFFVCLVSSEYDPVYIEVWGMGFRSVFLLLFIVVSGSMFINNPVSILISVATQGVGDSVSDRQQV